MIEAGQSAELQSSTSIGSPATSRGTGSATYEYMSLSGLGRAAFLGSIALTTSPVSGSPDLTLTGPRPNSVLIGQTPPSTTVISSASRNLSEKMAQMQAASEVAFRTLSDRIDGIAFQVAEIRAGLHTDEAFDVRPASPEAMRAEAMVIIASGAATDRLISVFDALADSGAACPELLGAAREALSSKLPLLRAASARVLANSGDFEGVREALATEANPLARSVMESALELADL